MHNENWKFMAFGFVSFVSAVWYLFQAPYRPQNIALVVPAEPIWESSHSWAQYSPWFAAEPYQASPSQCNIAQVNILQRHGARFPTDNAGEKIVSALEKLQSVGTYSDPNFLFLANFTYELGVNDLVALGAEQSFDAGRVAFHRYSHLVADNNVPFVRASGSQRVIFSATNWTSGFSDASKGTYNPVLSVIISEEMNNTLDDAMCPNVGDSDEYKGQWIAKFAPPIIHRLEKGAPGVHLTHNDVHNLMSLCPFHTVATKELSPFCNLFKHSDFKAYEYAGDLDKYYGTGYGQALGPVQGVGYINELLARLTNQPVRDNTQTNRTLDASPITFPLNRTIYADFSHDNQMIAIFSAMGLFRPKKPLNPTKPDKKRTWLASRLVPFSSRMVVEKLVCQDQNQYVRVLVNDVVQPLEFCGANSDGLCLLDEFVESQAYARNDGNGDFEKCFS